jgi:hypothetical protein
LFLCLRHSFCSSFVPFPAERRKDGFARGSSWKKWGTKLRRSFNAPVCKSLSFVEEIRMNNDKKRIWVIDDDEEMRSLLEDFFEEEEFEIDSVSKG